MKRAAPWTRFLLRAGAVLGGALAAFLAVFFLAEWLLPIGTGWLTSGDPPDSLVALAAVIGDFGAWGFAGLAVSGVLWLFGPWVDRSRPRSGAVAPAEAAARPGVFGLIPGQAWCFQSRPADRDRIAAGLAGEGVRIVVLVGGRGVGKTQLAAEAARQAAADGYGLVAWINAERGVVAELARLAEQLGLRRSATESDEELAEAARQRLEARDGERRLVVFDNVAEPDRVRPYLPAVGTAKVIVTSNRSEFDTMAAVTAIHIGSFDPDQGLAFLTAATGLADSAQAREVGEVLGWLPLGLTQAAAYIRQYGLTYSEYLTALATRRLDATLAQQAGADHPGVLAATALSLDGLERADPSGLGLRLLTVLSLLSPDGVTRGYLDRPGAAVFGADADLATALGVLSRLSLATVGSQTRTSKVIVHRLTARVIRFYAGQSHDPGLRRSIAAATKLLHAVADAIPADAVARRRSEVDELAAHVDALRTHAPADAGALRLSAQVGVLLASAGNLDRAVALLEGAVATYREQVGPADPLTLATANTLAGAYLAVGRSGEAVALYGETLAAREAVLGADHRDTLTSRNNLARAYAATGRLEAALALHRGTLAARERTLGPSDPDTLTSRNDLAVVYREAGQAELAVELLEQTLTARERVLGAAHPDTLTTANDLAGAYRAAGRVELAIVRHEGVLAGRIRILGADHPDTLASLADLGTAYRAAGRLRQAIACHRQALDARERVLGPDHPETLASRNGLAAALEQRRRLKAAVALYRSTLSACERVLGDESPLTRAVRSNVERAIASRRRQKIRRALTGGAVGLAVPGCVVSLALFALGVAVEEAEAAAAATQVVAPPTLAGRPPFAADEELVRAAAAEREALLAIPEVRAAVVALYGTPQTDVVYVKAIVLPVYYPEGELPQLYDSRATVDSVDPGPLGGVASCGTEVIDTDAGPLPFASCRWVDHGSTGQIVWLNESLEEARSQFLTLRGLIESRDA